ncbi:Uncharacterised protein [Listeria fleischmannii subsp. fleischmannii]|uniref:Uncharacterized protein n=1 Tax=Listeria fleischmannii subsp. fleischmannii TaxID=1671902 RepID=A0A2X3GIU4_9LIST|nr:Uncharacterised protein [Listeria fleischmannii subsp. fleischmannii]
MVRRVSVYKATHLLCFCVSVEADKKVFHYNEVGMKLAF